MRIRIKGMIGIGIGLTLLRLALMVAGLLSGDSLGDVVRSEGWGVVIGLCSAAIGYAMRRWHDRI
jgi:hypothetical protein